ncbi:TraM recognition domain-containing protein [Rothia sp. AR01]|uniref:TraM recognition domain-containing protein n=1 Tax=Rothia santali TaxID=2949643 RepID=A0A9X2KI43_9MICC|nr:TraM recognition domain-containing protein [Rothia santali]MCP3425828.1 TraM recognition domain-containing protein [Rothia santali]
MNQNNGNVGGILLTAALILVAVLLGGPWLIFGLATYFACGAWTNYGLREIFSGYAGGLDVSGLEGHTCLPSAGWSRGVAIALVILILVVVVVTILAWHAWTQSDIKFVRDLKDREGIAKGREVRRKAGRKALKQRAKSIRPTLDKPRLQDVGRTLGSSHYQQVWQSMEDSVILLGPPRSGKGFYIIINAILDSPGAVITTSTRGDNVAATLELRKKIGPCTVFDPQGRSGVKSTLKWSPYQGCETAAGASKRSQVLIGASGLGTSSNNQEWAQQAEIILMYLLHAAALGRVRVAEFTNWCQSPALAGDAVKILSEAPAATPGWAENLRSEVESDARTRGNKWMGVTGATAGLTIPEVAEALDPGPGEESLDPRTFIEQKGTLYLVGSKSGGAAIAPFLVALMDEIVDVGREMAFQLPGNRLDPPMALVLDEIANIAPWKQLPTIMADGGGVGISTLAVFQSPAQARGQWGEQDAQALIDSAILQIQLGGSNNDTELRRFVELAGQREVKQKQKSWSNQGTTHSNNLQDKQVFTVAELRRIPSGWGLLLNRNARPVLMKMVRWIDRKDAKEIKASQRAFEDQMKQARVDKAPPASVRS